VTSALGNEEWLRLRIGVGKDLPPEAKEAAGTKRPGRDYLLSPMRKGDLAVLDEVLDKVAAATRRIIQDGPGPAMNEFNRKDRE
jgi:PTH1 family peptidyl-tRNA hydrolase